jgi:diguanylate cyclase (GGDEF)-like protein
LGLPLNGATGLLTLRSLLLSLLLLAATGASVLAQSQPVPVPPLAATPDTLPATAPTPPSDDTANQAAPSADADQTDQQAAPEAEAAPPPETLRVVDFASPAAMLNLGGALSDNRVSDPAHPNSAWFTISIKNDGIQPVSRILLADDPPNSGLALLPQTSRPILREAAGSDSSLIIERAAAFGRFVFRVTLPPAHSATLALHFDSVAGRPALLAWTESALVAHNRRTAVLTGVVGGLLAAAAAFALGSAMLSGRPFDKWAGMFLTALLFADMVGAHVFDDGWFTVLGGPYGLLAFALSLAFAAGGRLVDHVAPFAAFHPLAGRWRDPVLLGIVGLGLAAALGIPAAGLLARLIVVAGAGAAAGYLAHFGRLGLAAPRHLAPAATVFALVTAAATFHALGLFPPNLVAPTAIGGFAAAGAMLVALACVLPENLALREAPLPLRARDDDDDREVISLAPAGLANAANAERAAMAASHQGVFDLDLATGLLTLSAEGAAILGLPSGATELSREAWSRRIHPDDRPIYEEALKTYGKEPGTAFRLEFRARGADEHIHWFELRATMTGLATEAERCLGLIADVTARKQSEADSAEAVRGDTLTGLPNRLALVDRLEYAGTNLGALTLMVFDLDRFKTINASLGADAADRVLQAVVKRMQKHFARQADMFRIGGVTFAVLTDKPAGELRAWGGAAVARLGEPFHLGGREIFLSASAGAVTGAQAQDPMDLLSLAELAMLQARRDGGGRACVYSQELSDAAQEDSDPVALEAELRRAMERGEIEIHYQPIIRLSDNSVAGFEALMRWKHPERGTVPPESFVGHSEETGLIRPLGRLALKTASEDVMRWQQFFPLDPPIFVSVNVSWRQISEDVFLRDLESVLRSTAVRPGTLKLEMTESSVMADTAMAERVLRRLHELGIGLAIDDFGTGHSALAQLKRFPFDVIKIDRSFLSSSENGGGKTILNSIVGLAHELGLEVVAEGVEDERDARRLRDLGCEYAQGYFFGMPIPASEVTSYIAMTYARPDPKPGLSAAGSRD